ncbi:hypothetical protein H1R20_g11746, partial [Candolleomyces eurysporus]
MSTNSTSTGSALNSLAEEIKCYSLPYGALGFVSHVLTYYTIACLWYGRKPLWPFSRVSFNRFDLALGGFGLLISTLLTIVTIVRCKDTWELLVIAIWKMSMSLLNGVTAVHVAGLFIMEKIRLKRARKRKRREGSDASDATIADAAGHEQEGSSGADVEKAAAGSEGDGSDSDKQEAPIDVVVDPMRHVFWWIILYVPGMFAGIVGVMTLAVKNIENKAVLKLTAGFYTVVGTGVLIVVAGLLYRIRNAEGGTGKKIVFGGLIWVVATFSILAVFYSDWALGMMTDNITGLPSGDTAALYWTYWISKRLPMFSL